MRTLFLSIALLLVALSAEASSVITVTVAVTNSAGVTNGQTITVNGNVRTATNSIAIPASQFLTFNTQAGAAENLLEHVALHPFASVQLFQSGATNIVLRAARDTALTVTVSAGWATVTSTNQPILGSGFNIRVPPDIETFEDQTNGGSQLALYLNRSTNGISLNTGKTNDFGHTILDDPGTNSFLFKSTNGLVLGTFNGSVLTNVHAALADIAVTATNAQLATIAITATNANKATGAISATNYWGVLHGTNWSFSTLVPTTAPTNLIIDCQGANYQKILATNNINIPYITNGPGTVTLKIFPNGADRVLTVNTNWVLLSTNNWYLTGSLWTTTITNAMNGSGPRAFWLSMVTDDPANYQTNVIARGEMSP